MSLPSSDESGDGAASIPPRCSFCKRAPGEGGVLVEGPILEGSLRVCICGDCVALCSAIVENQRARDADVEPIGPTMQKALRDKVDEVLASLSETEREVIRLVNGLSDGWTYTHDEIALRLGLPPARRGD